ncbi:MAG: hypothetical protein IJV31_02590 [Clostridia bacterium]|nr:hypothetical protein [Clostridia bacterium]
MDKEDLKWKEIVQQMEKASRAFESAGRSLDGRLQPSFTWMDGMELSSSGTLSWKPKETKKEDNQKYISIYEDIN